MIRSSESDRSPAATQSPESESDCSPALLPSPVISEERSRAPVISDAFED